ncbi:enoyl-CoA hydratase-related protein [Paenibacillus cymbidii]|uniref:enoyl-CoA hydratase-related protein n=1 Tax=Paenibacillus cymbidii TaxID=1639034 RepID=UPI0010807B52|nr:enoyl-CoA hydratase-related protein [Paenibacillus cymbidii]
MVPTALRVKVEKKVACITIDRPPVNALSRLVISELSQTLDAVAANPEIKAVVITGEGKCFVAGADLNELVELLDDRRKALKTSEEGQRLCDKIENLTKPVIAAINGACLGGGLELAMSCHIRIAADEAMLGLPEIKLGIIPGYGGTQRLSKLTDQAKALELTLTGESIDGKEAERVGLVNRSCPAREVMPRAIEMAETIALERSAVPVQAAMDAVLKGMKLSVGEGLALEANYFADLFLSGDAKEGIKAFLEKRKAVFRDC